MSGARRNPWKWFGVKTLYRTIADGRPQGTDCWYDPDFSLVEERIVLFRARSSEEAMKRAEHDAVMYADRVQTRNPYGQSIITRYLGVMDCFELFDDLDGSGTEVFSRTEVVSRKTSDSQVARSILGAAESKTTEARRRNVWDIALSKPAPGVKLTPEEMEFAARIRKKP